MAKLELERGIDVLLLETGDALLLEGILDYPISISPGLTAGVSINRDVAWDRGLSLGLTISATVVKLRARTIITTANLTINTIINRVVAYNRTIQAGLSIAAAGVPSGWVSGDINSVAIGTMKNIKGVALTAIKAINGVT